MLWLICAFSIDDTIVSDFIVTLAGVGQVQKLFRLP